MIQDETFALIFARLVTSVRVKLLPNCYTKSRLRRHPPSSGTTRVVILDMTGGVRNVSQSGPASGEE